MFWWVARWRRGDGVLVEDTYSLASVLQAASLRRDRIEVLQQRNDDETNGSKWPTIFAGGKVDKVETVKPVKAELKALEAPEETPKEKKLVKRVLIAIASAALVTVLPFG